MIKKDPITIVVSRPGYETAHVTLRPVATVGDSVSPRWIPVFSGPMGPGSMLTECPADSECGRIIIATLQAADDLLSLITERTEHTAIETAVRIQCNTVYFG